MCESKFNVRKIKKSFGVVLFGIGLVLRYFLKCDLKEFIKNLSSPYVITQKLHHFFMALYHTIFLHITASNWLHDFYNIEKASFSL